MSRSKSIHQNVYEVQVKFVHDLLKSTAREDQELLQNENEIT